MKFFIKTSICVCLTILLLAAGAWRYTEVQTVDETPQLTLDREQISEDLRAVNNSLEKVNTLISSAISKLSREI